MNTRELEQLIQRYFDAETSTAEEILLRRELAKPEANAPSADEARAVLGVFAAQRAGSRATRPRAYVRAVAAGLALLVAAGVSFFAAHSEPQAQYIAYVDGHVITDSQHVLAIMRSDLDEVHGAATSVDKAIENDLEQIFNAINSKNQ